MNEQKFRWLINFGDFFIFLIFETNRKKVNIAVKVKDEEMHKQCNCV